MSVFKRQEKKRKIALSSILTTVSVAALDYFAGDVLPKEYEMYLLLIIIGMVSLLLLWVYDFDLKFTELVFFLIPSTFYTIVMYLFMVSLRDDAAPSIFFALVWAIGLYVMIAASNIINVSTIRPVPLRKAALSALYFEGMVLFAVLGWIVFKAGWGINLGLIGYWIAASLFGASYLALSADDLKFRLLEVLIFGWIALQMIVLVGLWPSSILVAVISLAVWLFIVLGIIFHNINKNLKPKLLREYLFISLILLIVYLIA